MLQASDITGEGLHAAMAVAAVANSEARTRVSNLPILPLCEQTSRLAAWIGLNVVFAFLGLSGGNPQGIDLHVPGPTELFM